MLKIPIYDKYGGEKRIALLDNSTIAFMLKLDEKGYSCESLLQEYDVIFLPCWVAEEVRDSELRTKYVEKLVQKGIPIRIVKESTYSDLIDDEELHMFYIVKASVSRLGVLLKYMRLYVEKVDTLDIEPYKEWIKKMYLDWPIPSECNVKGRSQKKNAGEISLTILTEVFSWYYPDTEVLTVYTQDKDAYIFQRHAETELKKIFTDKIPVSVTYRSNDSIIHELYKKQILSLEEIRDIRKDNRFVTYTLIRSDKSISLETQRLNNEEFIKIIQDDSVQIIF